MRIGKDISREFTDLALLNRVFARYANGWNQRDQLERIVFYLADRYPDMFQKAVKHLKAIGKTWAQ